MIANLDSFRILRPFFRTSCGVGVLNSAIFNSFHNRVEFGTILGRLWNFEGGFEPPKPSPPRYVTGLVTASFQILLNSSHAILSSYLALGTLHIDTAWLNTVFICDVCYRNSFCRQPNSRVGQLSIVSSRKTYSFISYLRDNFFFTLHPSAIYQSQQSAVHFTSFKDSVPISVHITQEPTATTNPFYFPITETPCYALSTVKSPTI